MTITKENAEKAVQTILEWLGEDPQREGLIKTPHRFLKALQEHCIGYHQDPQSILSTTFEDVGNYQDVIILKDIPFESLCEHHLALFKGVAHVTYLPNHKVVGLSKLARLVDVFAKRLQIQERLTVQIAESIFSILNARGVMVKIEAIHHCLCARGVHKDNATMVTIKKLGVFESFPTTAEDVLKIFS